MERAQYDVQWRNLVSAVLNVQILQPVGSLKTAILIFGKYNPLVHNSKCL